MHPEAPTSPASIHHLQSALASLEASASDGMFDTMVLRSLAGVAQVLGQVQIAERARALLRTAPDEAFWANLITNIEPTKAGTERLRSMDSREQLEARYPLYVEDEIIEWIRRCARSEPHLALCLEGRVADAIAVAVANADGRLLEEVGITMACLGEFDAAINIARDPALEAFRQGGVRYVMVFETHRRGRLEQSAAILAELASDRLSRWEHLQLALGFSGRVPWGGYPYPDW